MPHFLLAHTGRYDIIAGMIPKLRPHSERLRKLAVPISMTDKPTTLAIRQAIYEAFELAGGVAYLVQVAKDDPRTFVALLAKVLPQELSGPNGGPIEVKNIEVNFVQNED